MIKGSQVSKKKTGILSRLVGIAAVSTIIISGCSSTTTSTNSTTIPPTTQSLNTFGALSQIGQGLYSSNCAQCHGASGQGITDLGTPALWGPATKLSKYNTAQGLLNYIVSTKPPGSPGSLPHETYVDVLCYLLIQNNEVSASSGFIESQLNNVAIK